MNQREQVASGLAMAMLSGPWSRVAMLSRVRVALGRPRAPRWVGELIDEVLAAYRDPPADRPRELAAYLQTGPAWTKAWRQRRPPRITDWTPAPTRIVRRRWPVAELNDHADLAVLLDLDPGELAWFADVRSLERHCPEALRHYRWTALRRPHGMRLVAAPKPRLKEIQRRLLRHVLAPIALHDAAHGGVRGRSVRTAVAPHVGADVVIRVDLQSFFASIPAGRIWNLLRVAGLPEGVAHTITGLVTTVAPIDVLAAHRAGLDPAASARLRVPHLPIGAPTSTALANLLCYSLDRRLDGLAHRFGASYTRYVDDLAFSGGNYLRTRRSRFLALVENIVRAEGFAVNDRKTVVLGDAGRQQLLGVVINDHSTLARPERDALRAILHNCATQGWRSQARGRPDFAAQLRGRIAWAGGLDPALGAKLLAAFERIDWS
jgi:hypothetical protein